MNVTARKRARTVATKAAAKASTKSATGKTNQPRRGISHGQVTEVITSELRRLIQIGEYRPGEHLRQDEIAERLNISRVPVREALTILTADGVVVHRPNQGYFVPKITPIEMQQIYLMRGVLETELLATVRWPTEEEFANIKAINTSLTEAIFQQKMDDVIARNREFHFAIFALSEMKLIEREIRRLWDMSDGYRRSILNTPTIRQHVIEEHLQIVAALEAKDAKALNARMADHRKSGWEKLVSLVS